MRACATSSVSAHIFVQLCLTPRQTCLPVRRPCQTATRRDRPRHDAMCTRIFRIHQRPLLGG